MILVGTTLTTFAMDRADTWGSWCTNAEQIRKSHADADDGFALVADRDVHYFASIQIDRRGLEPFQPLLDRLEEIAGESWTFSLDDGRRQVTQANRLRHICMGRNLLLDRACEDPTISHVLSVDADVSIPDDTLMRLLQVRSPVVGGEIPTYQLSGPLLTHHPRYDQGFGFPVCAQMCSAGFCMLSREAFRRLRWRWDLDAGESDDPCMARDAAEHLGTPILVRKDVVGRHHPERIVPIEHRGYDCTVVR